jgi:hypothetical protein
MNKCPCKGCICISVCKNKKYINLLKECETVWSYIFVATSYKMNKEKMKIVCKTLQPVRWGLKETETKIRVIDKSYIT